MLRLRMFGSLLSVLSLATAVWAWMTAASSVFFALLVAAICLAIVSPFDAPDPRRRTWVLIACLAYVAALATAVVFSRTGAFPSGALTGALFLLADLGVGLTCWALATRNRRRMSGSRRYYDN